MQVLLVEDEAKLAAQITQALQQCNYQVTHCAEGEEASYLGKEYSYALVILDLGLPQRDGISILKEWRALGRVMPVLVLTARSQWYEKVNTIDAGADDYLTKPFHIEELLARVRALLRRSAGIAHTLLQHGDIALDTRSAKVWYQHRLVNLTAHEYKLLAYLLHNPERLVTRAELTEHLYAQDFDRDSNTIEVFIGRLRKKLYTDLIDTLRGQGYRLQTLDKH